MKKQFWGFILGAAAMFFIMTAAKGSGGIRQVIFSLINLEVNGNDKNV